jgi:hypothetical protein
MKAVWSAINREYPKVEFNFLDCTNDDGIALSYDSDILPTVLVLNDENKVVDKLVGTHHKDSVVDVLKKHNFI